MGKVEIRLAQILEDLSQKRRVDVAYLAEKYQVSLVTIRKDLTELEARGLLHREQGFAVLNEKNSMYRRLASNHLTKRRLAKAAAALVKDGDTIMIESGSCCILLADELSKTKKNITIITNSVFMADYVGQSPNLHLVLLGGNYQPNSQSMVGPIARSVADTFHVKLFFAGTDGYRPGFGFTGDNSLRVELLHHMASSAEQLIILTESEKFNNQGVVPLFSFQQIHRIITDSLIPDAIKRELRDTHIRITTI